MRIRKLIGVHISGTSHLNISQQVSYLERELKANILKVKAELSSIA